MAVPADTLERVFGWKDIAEALSKIAGYPIGARTVMRYAKQNVDPIPLRNNRGTPSAYVSALRDWWDRGDMSHQAHTQLRTLAAEVTVLRYRRGKA